MKTYPIVTDNGNCIGFEISNSFISLSTISKLLKNHLRIQDIKKQKFFDSSEVRINFIYKNKNYIIWEPFGDNSRYWIGLQNEDNSKNNCEDIKNIERIFIKHKLFYFW